MSFLKDKFSDPLPTDNRSFFIISQSLLAVPAGQTLECMFFSNSVSASF